MQFDIITIFPEFFESVFSCGVASKAVENNLISINLHNLRDYSENKHKKVDDTPYGGGSGMLMNPGPFAKALKSIKDNKKKSVVILTSASAERFTDKKASEISNYDQVIILCGRYEGVDQRISEKYVDMELSIGDFVNSGGEYAASVIVDSASRYVKGVLGNSGSLDFESYGESLLEYPQYTKPDNFDEMKVPEVLLSGNHEKIRKWRRIESIKKTYNKRPELLDSAKLDLEETKLLKDYQSENLPNFRAYIALIHYPVYNKQLEIISSACKSIDVHDICRDATTFGVEKFYIVTPVEEQQKLVKKLISHWTDGPGEKYNETKKRAFSIVEIKNTIEETIESIEKNEGCKPQIVVTDARFSDEMIGYTELGKKIMSNDKPFLILFGTGWGLAKQVLEKADYTLKPIEGYSNYNHLSVRSAVAIILDRLLSCKI